MNRNLSVILSFVVLASSLKAAPVTKNDLLLVATEETKTTPKRDTELTKSGEAFEVAEHRYNDWLNDVVAKDGNRAIITMNCHTDVRDSNLALCKSKGWFFFDFPHTERATGVFKVISANGELVNAPKEPAKIVTPKAELPPIEIVENAPSYSYYSQPVTPAMNYYTIPSNRDYYNFGSASSSCPNGQCPLSR